MLCGNPSVQPQLTTSRFGEPCKPTPGCAVAACRHRSGIAIVASADPKVVKIYRYRQPSTNTLAEIAEERVWYSRYDQLNDPCEGLFGNRTGENTYATLIHSLRVCCFSLRRDSMLLWAHYAANHSGLCLEYEIADDVYRHQFLPINYSMDLPVLPTVQRYAVGHPAAGCLSINIDQNRVFFLTKSGDWSYEEERRVICIAKDPNSKGEKGEIRGGKLSAVYFGIRCDPAIVKIVSKLLSAQVEVLLLQASLRHGQYALEFTELDRASV